ncbi:MAG: hypothetical protein U1F76_25710 [Candidatus Competibacteraceae bacterium]
MVARRWKGFFSGSLQECQWEYSYDFKGKLVQVKAYYDFKGKLVQVKAYNESNKVVRIFIYQPSTEKNSANFIEILPFSKNTVTYDDNGYSTEWAYYDTNDQPIKNKDGFHSFKVKYNADGNWTEQTYFDTAEQPMILPEKGFHKVTRDYDGHDYPSK